MADEEEVRGNTKDRREQFRLEREEFKRNMGLISDVGKKKKGNTQAPPGPPEAQQPQPHHNKVQSQVKQHQAPNNNAGANHRRQANYSQERL